MFCQKCMMFWGENVYAHLAIRICMHHAYAYACMLRTPMFDQTVKLDVRICSMGMLAYANGLMERNDDGWWYPRARVRVNNILNILL